MNADPADLALDVLLERAKRARLRRSQREYPNEGEAQQAATKLVERFVAGDAAARARFRERVKSSQDLSSWLVFLATKECTELARTREPAHADRALAALALENAAHDPGVSESVLAVVWHRLHRAQLDPRAAFARATALAAEGAADGADGLAPLLCDFERSELFRDEVAPHLEHERLALESE